MSLIVGTTTIPEDGNNVKASVAGGPLVNVTEVWENGVKVWEQYLFPPEQDFNLTIAYYDYTGIPVESWGYVLPDVGSVSPPNIDTPWGTFPVEGLYGSFYDNTGNPPWLAGMYLASDETVEYKKYNIRLTYNNGSNVIILSPASGAGGYTKDSGTDTQNWVNWLQARVGTTVPVSLEFLPI